jgi:hypothetical protein
LPPIYQHLPQYGKKKVHQTLQQYLDQELLQFNWDSLWNIIPVELATQLKKFKIHADLISNNLLQHHYQFCIKVVSLLEIQTGPSSRLIP